MVKSPTKKASWTKTERERLRHFDTYWSSLDPDLKPNCSGQRPRGFFQSAAYYMGNKNAKSCKSALQKILNKEKEKQSTNDSSIPLHPNGNILPDAPPPEINITPKVFQNTIRPFNPADIPNMDERFGSEVDALHLFEEEQADFPTSDPVVTNKFVGGAIRAKAMSHDSLYEKSVILDPELTLAMVEENQTHGEQGTKNIFHDFEERIDNFGRERKSFGRNQDLWFGRYDAYNSEMRRDLKFESPKLNFNRNYKTGEADSTTRAEGFPSHNVAISYD